jgi:translation initiation factor 3 subunit B
MEEQRKTLGTEEKHKNESRSENMLAYWTPEVTNQPARITLMSFPGRAKKKKPLQCF